MTTVWDKNVHVYEVHGSNSDTLDEVRHRDAQAPPPPVSVRAGADPPPAHG